MIDYRNKLLFLHVESERILDEFLIGGQQRITTLFLLFSIEQPLKRELMTS